MLSSNFFSASSQRIEENQLAFDPFLELQNSWKNAQTTKYSTILCYYSVSQKVLNNYTTIRIKDENSFCTLEKYLQIFKNVFKSLKIISNSLQLYLINDIKTVENKLKEFSNVRKHLEIFENILSEYNT